MPENPGLTTSNSSTQPIDSKFSKRKVGFFLGMILVTLVAAGFYLFYYSRLLQHQTLIDNLGYQAQDASAILADPKSITFSRGNQIFITNFQKPELLLVPKSENLGLQIASLKISKNRNYIIWETEKGILELDVLKKQINLISTGSPRQSYDLSMIQNKALFLTSKKIIEEDLDSKEILHQFNLPVLSNSKRYFNHIKYSPDEHLAFIRSIHAWPTVGSEDALIDLQNGKVKWMKDFSNSLSLAPIWKSNSEILAWRGGLVSYSVESDKISPVIDLKSFPSLGAYSLSLDGQKVVFLTGTLKSPDNSNLYNPAVFVFDLKTKTIAKIIATDDPKLGGDIFADLSDVGWLDNDTIWLIKSKGVTDEDLWTFNLTTQQLSKKVTDLNQYSLSSVFTPITRSFTLY